MPIYMLRRSLVALALLAPLSAAHPTQTAPQDILADGVSDAEVAATFAGFDRLADATTPVAGAVDMATIAHTQPGAGEVADELDRTTGRSLGEGSASYYAAKFDGRRTASGETFDNDDLTAAHRSLPFGSKVRVTNPANGLSVVVRINDRGPFHKSRLIDVSHAAAKRLGLIARGHGRVALALLK